MNSTEKICKSVNNSSRSATPKGAKTSKTPIEKRLFSTLPDSLVLSAETARLFYLLKTVEDVQFEINDFLGKFYPKDRPEKVRKNEMHEIKQSFNEVKFSLREYLNWYLEIDFQMNLCIK